MKLELNKGKWSKMTLRYKICLFAVKLFEDHGIKVDRAERLFWSIYERESDKIKGPSGINYDVIYISKPPKIANLYMLLQLIQTTSNIWYHQSRKCFLQNMKHVAMATFAHLHY